MVSVSALASNKSMCFRPVLRSQRRPGGSCDSLGTSARSWIRMVMFPSIHLAAHVSPPPCPRHSPDHASLEISNLFQLESEHPFRSQGGNSLWLIIPNTYTRIHKNIWQDFKTQNNSNNKKLNKQTNHKTCLAIQWTISKVMARAPSPPILKCSFSTCPVWSTCATQQRFT